MRQVQSHEPEDDAALRQADSTTTVGPRTFAVDTGVYSLVHLGGKGKGSFERQVVAAALPKA